MATLVKFVKDETGEVTAIFPQLKCNKRLYGNDMLVSYAHCGQHSAAHKDWIKETTKANSFEYADLKFELQNIGYNLKICKH